MYIYTAAFSYTYPELFKSESLIIYMETLCPPPKACNYANPLSLLFQLTLLLYLCSLITTIQVLEYNMIQTLRLAKYILSITLWLGCAVQVHAQINENRGLGLGSGFGNSSRQFDRNGIPIDTSAVVDAKTVPVGLASWKLDTRFGHRLFVPVDTLITGFFRTNEMGGQTGHYAFLGNLGSPRLSYVFFERRPYSDDFFTTPYDFNYRRPEDVVYTDTKSPYVNLTYYKQGGGKYGEERFNGYFAISANKRAGFGGNIDYTYGRGQYTHQSTADFSGYIYGYYLGDKYKMSLNFVDNNFKTAENGGITDDRYVTNPLEMAEGKKTYSTYDMPTNLTTTWNHNIGYHAFLNHSYSLGFYRQQNEAKEKDTLQVRTYVPVTSFIHTVKWSSQTRKYVDRYSGNFYKNSFFGSTQEDEQKYLNVQNTFALALREGFNKWAKAGLTAFVKHDYRKYTTPDTITGSNALVYGANTEQRIAIGGELSKTQGNTLHYRAYGEVPVAGDFMGEFRLEGSFDVNVRLFKDTVRLEGKAYIINETPNYYLRRLHSKRVWWDNTLDKEWRTRIEGQLSLDRLRAKLKVGVENIKNYAYINDISTAVTNGTATTYPKIYGVTQHSDNIQILTAEWQQKISWKAFHLENVVTYQKSSNERILPLPQLTLYHNLYTTFSLSNRVLHVDLGAELRYFTKYYAPDYAPAIGQFTLQNEATRYKLGGYPLVNLYANLHLKRTRFFIMYNNAFPGWGNNNYFFVPHYPLNPTGLKLGLSWNFFD